MISSKYTVLIGQFWSMNMKLVLESFNDHETFSEFEWVRVYGVQCHFQQYFSYILAVNFIGGQNQSTRRKSLTYHKWLTNFII
jgi:hypothetical protein